VLKFIRPKKLSTGPQRPWNGALASVYGDTLPGAVHQPSSNCGSKAKLVNCFLAPHPGALGLLFGKSLTCVWQSAMSKREEDDEAEESTAFARIGQMRLHNREEKRHRLRQNATHNNDGVTDFYRNLLQVTSSLVSVTRFLTYWSI
jgi:hypothetical protein